MRVNMRAWHLRMWMLKASARLPPALPRFFPFAAPPQHQSAVCERVESPLVPQRLCQYERAEGALCGRGCDPQQRNHACEQVEGKRGQCGGRGATAGAVGPSLVSHARSRGRRNARKMQRSPPSRTGSHRCCCARAAPPPCPRGSAASHALLTRRRGSCLPACRSSALWDLSAASESRRRRSCWHVSVAADRGPQHSPRFGPQVGPAPCA